MNYLHVLFVVLLSTTALAQTPVQVGDITGNPYACLNEHAQTIKGVATTGGSGTFTYRWQSSHNGSLWTDISGATNLHYSPGRLSQDTYFRLVSTDDDSADDYFSKIFKISIIPEDVTFEWLENPEDHNWNNPANWRNSLGLIDAVPTKCSNVFIGTTQKTPSLDPISTIVTQYGEPTTRNITFSYGGELAYPHNLSYDKAFIRYNWGVYGTSHPEDGANLSSGDPLSDTYLVRNKYHMLSAPLKKMTSGDFSLAGYPFTWQQDFVLHTTPTAGGAIIGDFSKPFATNDIDLSTQNHAIVVKVAGAGSSMGYNKHTNLEGLNGVMEMPYFENQGTYTFRQGHSYDKITKTSTFYYYNTQTLELLSTPTGSLKRASEAYRFVYENDDNSTPIIPSLNNAKGYTLSISSMNTGGAVMIGNPYMASINMKNFIDSNNNIDETKGYYAFDGNTDTWKQFLYSATNHISPLQAFVVTLKPTITNTDLYFPLEGTYALTGPDFKGNSSIAPGSQSIWVTISDGFNHYNKESDNYAILATANEFEDDVRKILYKESTSSDLYFIPKTGNKTGNLVQVITSEIDGVDIGFSSSGTSEVQVLQFNNIKEFMHATGKYPILIDKLLNTEQDLNQNPIYSFRQQPSEENNYIDESRFTLILRNSAAMTEEATREPKVEVAYYQGSLSVKATIGINNIQVYNLFGQLVYNSHSITEGTLYLRVDIPVGKGCYIVEVKTIDNKKTVSKILVY